MAMAMVFGFLFQIISGDDTGEKDSQIDKRRARTDNGKGKEKSTGARDRIKNWYQQKILNIDLI